MDDRLRTAIMAIVLGLWAVAVGATMVIAMVNGRTPVDAVPAWMWGIAPSCYMALRAKPGGNKDSGDGSGG